MVEVSFPEFETELQDIENYSWSLEALIQKYISPIEKIRSIAKVPFTDQKFNFFSNFAAVSVEKEPQESLTHTFYRYLGFPVLAPDGSFYSPGFSPLEVKKIKRKQEIANKILNSSSWQNILIRRELLSQEKKFFFSFQDIRSTLLALILKVPRPFNLLSPNLNLDSDQQTYVLPARNEVINSFSDRNLNLKNLIDQAKKSFSSSVFSSDLTHGQQILKPFILDPRIENTVLPDNRQICAPFLPANLTILSSSQSLLRPGIELIIRERINPANNFSWLNQAEKILKGEKSPSKQEDQNLEELRLSLGVLTSEQGISDSDFLSILDDQNQNNVLIFNNLLKTLKFLIRELIKKMQILDQIEQEINWFPVLSPNGPRDGLSGAFLKQGLSQNFPLEQKIIQLRIQKLNQEQKSASGADEGSFASPFEFSFSDENLENYSLALQEALNYRSSLAEKGFLALRDIEYLTGEVSGLGLIDVIIIYAALWTIPISSLLGLLDQDSYQRLQNTFPSLVSAIQSIGQDDIFLALQNIEKYIFNLQNYVEKLFLEQKSQNIKTY